MLPYIAMSSVASPGPSTLKTDAVLIFDLDGTILSVNSFPHWVTYMLTGRFGGLSLLTRAALTKNAALALAERKILHCDHYKTKRRMQALWSKAVAADPKKLALDALIASLEKKVRPNMAEIMTLVSLKQADAILATSAAGEYAQGLAEHLGFSHILTTPAVDKDLPENSSEQKRDRTLAYLASQSWQDRKRIFFTDHEEDLPLIKECHLTAWFGPDDALAELQKQAPAASIVACLNRSGQEILRLVMP